MSQPASPNLASRQAARPVQKQRLNVYTMMLVISFLALVTACVLLLVELGDYGPYPWWNTQSGRVTTTSQLIDGSSVAPWMGA